MFKKAAPLALIVAASLAGCSMVEEGDAGLGEQFANLGVSSAIELYSAMCTGGTTDEVCYKITAPGTNNNVTHVGLEGTPCGGGPVEYRRGINTGVWTALPATGGNQNHVTPSCNRVRSGDRYAVELDQGHSTEYVCFRNVKIAAVHAKTGGQAGCHAETAPVELLECGSCMQPAPVPDPLPASCGTGQFALFDTGNGQCWSSTGWNAFGGVQVDQACDAPTADAQAGFYLQDDGAGACIDRAHSNPDAALGGGTDGGYVTVGPGGHLIVQLNLIARNVAGADLVIHEVTPDAPGCGPGSPRATVEVASPAKPTQWHPIGTACGGATAFDFADTFAHAPASLRNDGALYVRISHAGGDAATEFRLDQVEGVNCGAANFVACLPQALPPPPANPVWWEGANQCFGDTGWNDFGGPRPDQTCAQPHLGPADLAAATDGHYLQGDGGCYDPAHVNPDAAVGGGTDGGYVNLGPGGHLILRLPVVARNLPCEGDLEIHQTAPAGQCAKVYVAADTKPAGQDTDAAWTFLDEVCGAMETLEFDLLANRPDVDPLLLSDGVRFVKVVVPGDAADVGGFRLDHVRGVGCGGYPLSTAGTCNTAN